jgi:hypothetical protein
MGAHWGVQDPSRLVDVCRQSIMFDTFTDVAACLDAIGRDPEVQVHVSWEGGRCDAPGAVVACHFQCGRRFGWRRTHYSARSIVLCLVGVVLTFPALARIAHAMRAATAGENPAKLH